MRYAVFAGFGGKWRQEGQEVRSLSAAKYLQGRALDYYASRGYVPVLAGEVVELQDRAGLRAGIVKIAQAGEGEPFAL